MAHKTGDLSKLRVGEIGEKRTKNGRILVMKRIRSSGFPQFVVLENRPG